MRKYLLDGFKLLSKLPVVGNFFKTLLAAAAVGAGSTEIEHKNYANALEILNQFENDEIDDVWVACCQYMLGNLYLKGLGVLKNEEKAIAIFQLAARAGNDDAIKFMKRWNAIQRSNNSNKSLQPTADASAE